MAYVQLRKMEINGRKNAGATAEIASARACGCRNSRAGKMPKAKEPKKARNAPTTV